MAAGQTVVVFHAAGAQISTTADALLSAVNEQFLLVFPDAANKEARFQGIMPSAYSAVLGVDVILHLRMASATSGAVDLDVAFERQTGLDLTTSSFAAVQSVNGTTVPGTRIEFTVTVPFAAGSAMASVVAGDMFRLKVIRDAVSDTATGDMELRMIEIRER